MPKDPIIDEIRKNRREIAEKFGYDLRAIIADARKRQKKEKSDGKYPIPLFTDHQSNPLRIT